MKLYLGPLDAHGRPDINVGDVFIGLTKLDILQSMMEPPGFSMNRERDPDKFMSDCLAQLENFFGITDFLPDGTLEERLDAFFDILVASGLGAWMEDN
jgi:hypothetical protein